MATATTSEADEIRDDIVDIKKEIRRKIARGEDVSREEDVLGDLEKALRKAKRESPLTALEERVKRRKLEIEDTKLDKEHKDLHAPKKSKIAKWGLGGILTILGLAGSIVTLLIAYLFAPFMPETLAKGSALFFVGGLVVLGAQARFKPKDDGTKTTHKP